VQPYRTDQIFTMVADNQQNIVVKARCGTVRDCTSMCAAVKCCKQQLLVCDATQVLQKAHASGEVRSLGELWSWWAFPGLQRGGKIVVTFDVDYEGVLHVGVSLMMYARRRPGLWCRAED